MVCIEGKEMKWKSRLLWLWRKKNGLLPPLGVERIHHQCQWFSECEASSESMDPRDRGVSIIFLVAPDEHPPLLRHPWWVSATSKACSSRSNPHLHHQPTRLSLSLLLSPSAFASHSRDSTKPPFIAPSPLWFRMYRVHFPNFRTEI